MKLPFLFLVVLSAAVLAQSAPNTLSPEEQKAGFKLLFDGTRVLGLRGVQKSDFLKSGWKIADGALVLEKSIQMSGKMTGGDLMTTESFVDFDFQFEWKIGVSGNSGILYFVKTMIGKPVGSEFQIIDDVHHPEGLKGGPIMRTGALLGVLRPGENKQLNATGWNEGRLLVQGAHVEHWVNSEKVLEYEVGSPAFQQAVKASALKLPMGFGTKVRSPLLLLDQGEDIAFRSLKVRAIPPGQRPGP